MATRRERVILDLQDDFTPGIARAAATTSLLNRELNSLSGQEINASRSSQAFSRDIDRMGRDADGAGKQIDKLSGRLSILLDAAAIIGPAFVPMATVAVPAVTGLAAQMGFAATGAAGFVVAIQGLGDALKAMNKAHLEPTAENLAAARIEMEKLSPAGQDLTRQLFGLRDEWKSLRDVSQEALFPGLSSALDDLETRLPDVQRILANVNTTVGEMLADGAESLGSPRWDDFFTFIATDAPPAISSMGTALGSVAHAMSELWMAFDPLNDGFSVWLQDATAGLDRWAQGLDQTQGFQEFVDYIRETGPQVAETLAAVALAVVRIGEAAAPLGGPVLASLEAVAKAIGTLADSNAGPAIMATVTSLALLRRGMAGFEAIQRTSWAQGVKGAETFGQKVTAARSPLLKTSAAMAGIAIASSDTAQGFGLANAASGALLGTMGGPWGAAIGGAVGLMIDLTGSTDGFKVNAESLTSTLNQQTGAITENTTAYAANELEKQGVLKAAQDLGLSLADVTQASLGNAAAQDRVTASLAAQDAAFFDANGRVTVGTEALMAHRESAGQVEDAIGQMSGEVANGQTRIGRMADATDAAADSLGRAETAARDFSDAVTRLNDLLSGRAAMRDYEAAVDDFTAALKENGNTFDINTEKGRENQAGLDNIVGTTLKVAESMKGAARQRFLTSAISDLRDMGDKFDIPKAQIKILIGMLRDANNVRVNPKIGVDTSVAEAHLRAFQQQIDSLRDGYVDIHVNRTGGDLPYLSGTGADGTTVPKTGLPYADRHLYMLADGEEVISNRHGQADRHRPLLKAINGGLADGGTAGDKAREAREKAQRAAEERARREEEKRQRQLDRQRTKDLLASDLSDEREQARLEVKDARRRLRSAREAGRPKDEIREARLALKGERADIRDIRESAKEERAQKRADEREKAEAEREKAEDERVRQEEERAEHESRMFLAAIEGQENAAKGLIDAAETQKKSAESVRDGWAQAMERTGAAATAGFQSSLFGGGSQQHGLWSGPGGGSGGSSWLSALQGDISGLQERSGLIAQLSAQGISGSALEALLAQGSNADISQLLNSGQAGQFAATFAQREALLGSVSSQAGTAAYGAEFAAASAQVLALSNTVLALQAELAAISAQRPITVYEAYSAQATAAEIARLQSIAGAA